MVGGIGVKWCCCVVIVFCICLLVSWVSGRCGWVGVYRLKVSESCI